VDPGTWSVPRPASEAMPPQGGPQGVAPMRSGTCRERLLVPWEGRRGSRDMECPSPGIGSDAATGRTSRSSGTPSRSEGEETAAAGEVACHSPSAPEAMPPQGGHQGVAERLRVPWERRRGSQDMECPSPGIGSDAATGRTSRSSGTPSRSVGGDAVDPGTWSVPRPASEAMPLQGGPQGVAPTQSGTCRERLRVPWEGTPWIPGH
jgi:hypothetical protein